MKMKDSQVEINISVEDISRLAKLSLSQEEREKFGSQLQGILKYVEKLKELDTEDIKPTSHVISLNNIMRDDAPADSILKENALMNAPEHNSNFYRVPKIIE